ncbi:FCD domain-containing protein [Roseomonas sp. CCTCC AB2023176]|uniref:GntR family transcriptional regulator n=1 Tax=Roseomonas sp. CCTCC AB2023176 TaxID=3342640 RepID=UPI0035DB59C6
MPASATNLHHDLARAARALWLAEGASAGTPVAEAPLAARLAVSRTPLRAALRLLAEAGITERRGRATVLRDPARPLPEPDPVPEEALIATIARDHAEGRLPDHVTEADVIRRYGAARGTVSRALSRLHAMGVVERERAQGWRFAEPLASESDRAAAHRFRLVLEPAALLEPRYRLDPGFVREMRAAHAAVLARPFRRTDAVPFFEMNAAFHLGLARGAGNRFFVAAVEHQNGLRRLRNYGWRFDVGEAHLTCREHLAVLDAVEDGKASRAAELLAAHIERAGP